MNIRNTIFSGAIAAAVSLVGAAPAFSAEKFPDKAIQLVIPFSPGDTDQMLRPIVDKMNEYLGQPVVMSYKPGAGGGVGAGFVAAAKADGYTIVGSSPGALVIVPLANKDVKYTTDSFTPIASLSQGGLMLLVPAKSKYQTLADVVKSAKENPGTITYGSSGAMGITHLMAEVFAQEAKISIRHIPFQGSGPGITALLGGHTDMASAAIGPAQSHIKAGTLRALAVFSDKRLAAFPEVPTVKESGFQVGSPTLYGIVAPHGTSKKNVDAIYNAAQKVVEAHRGAIEKTLGTLGGEINLLGPEAYGAYLAEQKKIFSSVVSAIKE